MFTVQDNNESTSPKPILINSNCNNEFQTASQTNLDDFEIKQPIGYGSSAVVYSAIYIPFSKRVAIKVIDLDMFERNQIDELRRETSLMALSKHPHILRVYGSFVHGSKLYIVTPYMAVGSCLDIIKIKFPEGLDEISIATILKQALEGLTYLHKNGHIHRDVKAGNLLMDEDGTVLLADFGVSSSLMETGERGVRKTFVGTPCWMAPEVMEQADYDYKADIWSFGITAIELATGQAPFAKFPPLKVLMMTLNNDPPTIDREATNNRFSKAFKDMIDSCMNKDPSKRPTSEKLLAHPFFKQAKKPEWLIKSILVDIPPIENRPTKKVPQKKLLTTSTDEWDFNDGNKQPEDPPSNIQQIPGLHTPKRHISFGHVVVRKPSNHAASESWSYSPSSNFTLDLNATSSNSNMVSPPRKGRALSDDFIIESSRIAASRHLQQHQPSDEMNKRKLSFTKHSRVRHGSLHERTPTVTFSEDIPTLKLLHRTISHDDSMHRKPRFNPQHSPPPFPSTPLSRTNSNISAGACLTRENSTHSRSGRSDEQLSEARKVGRFELTSTESSRQTSVAESISPYSTHSSNSTLRRQTYQAQLEDLLRNNEIQRFMLLELKEYCEQTRLQQQDTIESLEQQLQTYQRENHLLQRENDIMRRQIEQLKKNTQ